MARCLRRRARLDYYDVGQIDVAVVCALLAGFFLCQPLHASQTSQTQKSQQTQHCTLSCSETLPR